ncbi:ABC transporter permease [Lysinibacillus irui]|uniref:ABC transporter permease n=1 Tax=Lysinibacillus irui TaxID=2998077 RepID=A0AAJ5UQL9_9BACI|nr:MULTISPECIES: ABC transporter permease [Lysinibacillus]MEA0555170.1 ABC transporter permease [Lysinibacillus irui]MEA0976885.1 ABC transporter permease [Lysinibacillus irui]MEA1043039.1 ABC transporter permease [Lysinibacillus irui]WDV05786.1 ABC transporter permease [Lysinibacillus irui]
MYCLKLKYQVKKVNDFFMIQDCVTLETVMAFKVKDMEFNKLKEIVYHGIDETTDSSENRLGKQLLEKDSKLFTFYEKQKSRDLLNLVRSYTEFFTPYFISTEAISEYVIFAEKIIETGKIFNVQVFLEDKFPNVQEFLEKSPFIQTVYDEKQQNNIDLLIGTQKKIVETTQIDSFANYVLALSCQENSLEIGPLINTTKFEIPKFSLEGEQNAAIMHHEELLMCFFLERILFIQLFKLYNKMRQNEFFPTRNKVCINRMDLQGYSEAVTLYPKYLVEFV